MSRRHDSENEDDPEPFQSSGDEWDLEQAKKEEGNNRRKSARISRKPKRPVVDESASDEDEEEPDISEEEEESSDEEASSKKRKAAANKKGGGGKGKTSPKKQKVSNDDELSNDTNSNLSQEGKKEKEGESDSDSSRTNTLPSRGIHRKFIPKTIYSEDYATGSFVILKKDAQGGDPSKHPVIWRIDGKALLQKYEAFDENDKVRHKNTSIYTGWSPLDKDLYAPITVDVIRHNNNNLTVEVQWDKLKVINADSD